MAQTGGVCALCRSTIPSGTVLQPRLVAHKTNSLDPEDLVKDPVSEDEYLWLYEVELFTPKLMEIACLI